jgi:hypothetical protein
MKGRRRRRIRGKAAFRSRNETATGRKKLIIKVI